MIIVEAKMNLLIAVITGRWKNAIKMVAKIICGFVQTGYKSFFNEIHGCKESCCKHPEATLSSQQTQLKSRCAIMRSLKPTKFLTLLIPLLLNSGKGVGFLIPLEDAYLSGTVSTRQGQHPSRISRAEEIEQNNSDSNDTSSRFSQCLDHFDSAGEKLPDGLCSRGRMWKQVCLIWRTDTN